MPDDDAAEQGGQDQQDEHPMQVRKDLGLRTDTTATLAPLSEANPEEWLGTNTDPDVMLSVPNIGIDHIGITVDNLRADVQLHAKVLDLLELDVGAQVSIEKVEVNIENVRVQAMLKVNLGEVYRIVDRVMTTIDNNPEILTNLTKGLGKGLEGALSPKSIEGSSTITSDEPQQPDEQPESPESPEPPEPPESPEPPEKPEPPVPPVPPRRRRG